MHTCITADTSRKFKNILKNTEDILEISKLEFKACCGLWKPMICMQHPPKDAYNPFGEFCFKGIPRIAHLHVYIIHTYFLQHPDSGCWTGQILCLTKYIYSYLLLFLSKFFSDKLSPKQQRAIGKKHVRVFKKLTGYCIH